MLQSVKNLTRPLLPKPQNNQGLATAPTRWWANLQDWARRDRHLDNTGQNAHQQIADYYLSSVVMSCVGWIASMLPTCPWLLEEKVDGAWQPVDTHPILDLLIKPTEWHTGQELLECLLIDRCITGNAYLQRVSPMASGPPMELWFTPHNLVKPDWDSTGLKGWEYQQNGRWMPQPADAFIQIRHRQSPVNPFMGVSPLAPLVSEVWLDREATRITTTLIAKPFLGQIVTLEDTDKIEITEASIEATRQYLKDNYSGAGRGDLAFFPFPARSSRGAFVPPEVLHPKSVHDFVEERVSSIFKIPAAVLQFGTGLEQTTQNATLVQYEKQAWESGLMPVGDQISQQLGNQLLPSFGLDVSRYRLTLDYSGVEALQPNRLEDAQAHEIRVRSGQETRAEAREAQGLEVFPSDHVYLMPISVVEVPQGKTQLEADKERADALTPPQLQGEGAEDGNDTPDDDDAEEDDEMKSWQAKRLSSTQRRDLLQAFARDSVTLEAEFQAELVVLFEEMGRAAATAAEATNES